MKKYIFIDGIGDYSIVKRFYNYEECDNLLLILSHVISTFGIKTMFFDTRNLNFTYLNLFDQLQIEKPDSIIIKGDITTVSKIKRIELERYTDTIYILSYDHRLLSGIYNVINLNEKDDIKTMLHLILTKIVHEITVEKLKYPVNYWDIINDIQNKNISLKIHEYKSESEINLQFLADEIEFLVENKKIFKLHINNRYGTANDLVDLTNKIRQKTITNKFAWSCTMTSNVMNEIVDFKELIDLNLRQIFIDISHANENILKEKGQLSNENALVKSIQNAYNNDITSIVINYEMGNSQYENINTLNELADFFKLLVELFPGVVEINMQISADNQGQCISDGLTRYQLIAYEQSFHKNIFKIMRGILPDLKLKDRFKHIEISRMNFKTQYFDNFISKTRIALRDNNVTPWKLYYYSFEIKDDILSYAPCCPVMEAYEVENLKPFLTLDPLTTKDENSKFWLNEDEFYLFKMAKKYISLSSIINSFVRERQKNDFNIAKAKVIAFYEKLENYGVLYYSQILH